MDSTLADKYILVTGATSGMGKVTAQRLAERGATVVIVGRNAEKTQATMEEIQQRVPKSAVRSLVADLTSRAQVRALAQAYRDTYPRLDVLVNNAGGMFGARQLSSDGLEMTFALNHMAYFVTTELLRPRLKPGARIVTTASNAHRGAKLDFDDLQSRKWYSGFPVYSKSKLCNILFNRALARRLKGSGVTANALHPGFVATRFGDNSGGLMRAVFKVAKPIGAISPEEGARTITYLASAPEVADISGEYFYECKIATPSPEARNDEDAERLWEISEGIAAL